MDERVVVICDCGSLEHQLVFWYDVEDDKLFCEPHLVTHRSFLKRLWRGMKYAFGYKSRFGDWDSTVFTKEDQRKLRMFLNKQNQ